MGSIFNLYLYEFRLIAIATTRALNNRNTGYKDWIRYQQLAMINKTTEDTSWDHIAFHFIRYYINSSRQVSRNLDHQRCSSIAVILNLYDGNHSFPVWVLGIALGIDLCSKQGYQHQNKQCS